VGPHSSLVEGRQATIFDLQRPRRGFRDQAVVPDAWKWGQRCLVVTDGFYEWKKLDAKGKEKQPYAIAMADDGQMVMAGLWAKWKSPNGGQVLSCTVMTCGANAVIGELHDRMPVILGEVTGRNG
jgi:putative SOS response-associated peptidase YedK